MQRSPHSGKHKALWCIYYNLILQMGGCECRLFSKAGPLPEWDPTRLNLKPACDLKACLTFCSCAASESYISSTWPHAPTTCFRSSTCCVCIAWRRGQEWVQVSVSEPGPRIRTEPALGCSVLVARSGSSSWPRMHNFIPCR
jgi:hypothetical protein